MIRLSTFLELQQNRHTLGLYCVHCNRWAMADLQGLIDTGRGGAAITAARFRCQECGSIADKQVRPPAPSLGDTVRYI